MLGAVYQPISVLHDQSSLPVSGSNPTILFCRVMKPTTSSDLRSGTATRIGMHHDSSMPPARQTSFPVFLFNPMTALLSAAAFTISKSPWRIGDEPEPKP